MLPELPSSSRAAPRAGTGLSVTGWEGKGPLPANHLPVPVHGDVRPGPVVIRSKVTVGGSKPLIKSMLQGVELRPVAQMPRNRNPGHFREPRRGTLQSSVQQHPITFTEHFTKQASLSTQNVLRLDTARPRPPGDVSTCHPLPAMLPRYSHGSWARAAKGPVLTDPALWSGMGMGLIEENMAMCT